MANKGARKAKHSYGREITGVRRSFTRSARRKARQAIVHEREPERVRGTQGWLTW